MLKDDSVIYFLVWVGGYNWFWYFGCINGLIFLKRYWVFFLDNLGGVSFVGNFLGICWSLEGLIILIFFFIVLLFFLMKINFVWLV